jgi:hypothetical protein
LGLKLSITSYGRFLQTVNNWLWTVWAKSSGIVDGLAKPS